MKTEETVPFVIPIKHGKTFTRTVLIVPDIFLAVKTARKYNTLNAIKYPKIKESPDSNELLQIKEELAPIVGK